MKLFCILVLAETLALAPSVAEVGRLGGQSLYRGPAPIAGQRLVENARLVVAVADPAANVRPQGSPASAVARPNPFFAFCMDTHDAKKRSLDEQARLLKELGYDGAGHLWLDGVSERLQTLEAAGLKLFQVYFRVDVSPEAKPPYDTRLKEVLPLLRGRDVMLTVLVTGGKPSDESHDGRAVGLLREIADLARPHQVKVALYHHVNDWLERVEDGLRLAKKVDRANVGVMFNLCHWLKVDEEQNLKPLLKACLPRLFAVSINGSDRGADIRAGQGQWIAPLDTGSFDLRGFLGTLRELGYAGPIGLQCYGIGGDAREHLTRSISAWRRLNAAPLGKDRGSRD